MALIGRAFVLGWKQSRTRLNRQHINTEPKTNLRPQTEEEFSEFLRRREEANSGRRSCNFKLAPLERNSSSPLGKSGAFGMSSFA